MSLAQTKLHLEKIIALYKSMSVDEKNISTIERDLMLSHVRNLYEAVLELNPSVSSAVKVAEPVKVPTPPVTPPPPPPPPVIPTPVAKPEPAKAPVAPPPPPPIVEPVAKAPEPAPVAPPPPPPVAPPPPPVQPSAPAGSSKGEISALFEETALGKELSDKLANTPIADLTKAFGLNDRLLKQNELFGGNKAVFDEALKDLNNSSSFDTAKSMLQNFAERYNWALNDDRKKQAKEFIKLVRRRFIA